MPLGNSSLGCELGLCLRQREPVWEPCEVLLSLAYMIVRRVLELIVVLVRTELSKDAELLCGASVAVERFAAVFAPGGLVYPERTGERGPGHVRILGEQGRHLGSPVAVLPGPARRRVLACRCGRRFGLGGR